MQVNMMGEEDWLWIIRLFKKGEDVYICKRDLMSSGKEIGLKAVWRNPCSYKDWAKIACSKECKSDADKLIELYRGGE